MGAIALFKNEISYIHEELLPVSYLGTKKLALIENFLSKNGFLSLSDVDTETVVSFNRMIFSNITLTANERAKYSSALETAVRVHLEATYKIEGMDELKATEDKKRKLSFFLHINQISSFEEITAELRVQFEKYLTDTGFAKVTEYVKVMDVAKFHALELSQSDFRPHVLKYNEDLVYLAYHPDFKIAHRFFYTQIKDPLFFDFTADVSSTIKHQVFDYLKYLVEDMTDCSTHYLLQQFITPLWSLYNYCISHNIEDISKIMEPELSDMEQYINSTCSYTSGNIVNQLRKYTFLNSKMIDWEASAWYLERINFSETRMNPARPFEAFYFDDIKISENLGFLKQCMKYQIGLSTRLSITSIYAFYNTTKHFLYYCDENNLLLTKMTKADFEEYISFLFTEDVKPATVNKHIGVLAKFISFLEIHEHIVPLGFHFECYKATEIHTHNDISVSKEDQNKVFSVLDQFPEDIRLMFLNLWASGLRVNEVCALKGNAYIFDGTNSWLHIYQSKAKREKQIPIPSELYHMMKEYISRNKIKSTDYIFPAPKADGCYRASTFTKKVKEILDKNGISETYHFRSHGYRHTLATELYMGKSNVQSIREYLGHASENMTRQYIDHLPNLIDEGNNDYFNSKTLSWK